MEKLVLKYSIPPKLLAIILLAAGTIGTFFIASVAIEKKDPDTIILVSTCLLLLVGLPLLLFMEFFYVKYTVDNHKISSSTPWSRNKEIKWSDTTEVKYNNNLKWYVLRDKTNTIRVGEMVAGLNSLFEIMEQQIHSDIFNKFLKDME